MFETSASGKQVIKPSGENEDSSDGNPNNDILKGQFCRLALFHLLSLFPFIDRHLPSPLLANPVSIPRKSKRYAGEDKKAFPSEQEVIFLKSEGIHPVMD